MAKHRQSKETYRSINHHDWSFSPSSGPYIGYKMLSNALTKPDDELILYIERSSFQLDKYLSDARMKEKFDWLQMLTTIFERILGALGQEHRIATILVRWSFSFLTNLCSGSFSDQAAEHDVFRRFVWSSSSNRSENEEISSGVDSANTENYWTPARRQSSSGRTRQSISGTHRLPAVTFAGWRWGLSDNPSETRIRSLHVLDGQVDQRLYESVNQRAARIFEQKQMKSQTKTAESRRSSAAGRFPSVGHRPVDDRHSVGWAGVSTKESRWSRRVLQRRGSLSRRSFSFITRRFSPSVTRWHQNVSFEIAREEHWRASLWKCFSIGTEDQSKSWNNLRPTVRQGTDSVAFNGRTVADWSTAV